MTDITDTSSINADLNANINPNINANLNPNMTDTIGFFDDPSVNTSNEILGWSPDVSYKENNKPSQAKPDTTLQTKTRTPTQYIIIVVLIVVIIYLIYRVYSFMSDSSHKKHRNAVAYHFNNIHGDIFDDEAKLVIQHGEKIENPEAIDHYRIGTVYLINAQDPYNAHNHFRQALEHIIEGTTDLREADYIIDRIEDYRDHFMDYIDIEELPLQHALMTQANNNARLVEGISETIPEIKKDDPEFVQKTLLSRKRWESDSQNVHDSVIYKELFDQLQMVRDENNQVKNIYMHDYSEIRSWLRMYYEDDPKKLEKVDKVLKFLDKNNPVGTLTGINEQDIIVNVWRRSYDKDNDSNFNAIRSALADAILDCVEGDHAVCMAGRSAKIWQALAQVDKNPEIGILKSKQLVRNEIYERCAKVVSDYVGENGSASGQLKDAYNQSAETEQVKELIECMHKDMDAIKEQYRDLLSNDQLDTIITECKSVAGNI
jgi:hypothetical protein